jgi:hypothetical protein
MAVAAVGERRALLPSGLVAWWFNSFPAATLSKKDCPVSGAGGQG